MSLRAPREESASIYKTQLDRDNALEATYSLSDVLRAALDLREHPRSILALVAEHVTDLAELFWSEAATTGGTDPRTKFDTWSVRHFGRQLEPSCRGMLWCEARARMRGATTAIVGLYDSWGEQQRYERAARELGPWKGGNEEQALARAERIVKLATGKTVDELSPPKLLSKRAWEKRKAELLRQARSLENAEAKA